MKRMDRIDTAVRLVLIALSALLVVIPLYFVVLNSFKPYAEIASNIAAWPVHPTLKNFKAAWVRLDFLVVLKNTVLVTLFSSLGCMVLSGMTGYWIARHANKFTRTWNFLFLSGMCVPFQCVMITFAKMIGNLNLSNHIFGVVVSFWVFSLPMSMFLISGAVKSIPLEIEEAATIDGCSSFKLYWQIVFPLIRGTIFTIVTLNVLTYDKSAYSIQAATDIEFVQVRAHMDSHDRKMMSSCTLHLPFFRTEAQCNRYDQDCKTPGTISRTVLFGEFDRLGRLTCGMCRGGNCGGTIEKGHPEVHQWNYALGESDYSARLAADDGSPMQSQPISGPIAVKRRRLLLRLQPK